MSGQYLDFDNFYYYQTSTKIEWACIENSSVLSETITVILGVPMRLFYNYCTLYSSQGFSLYITLMH